MRLKTDISTLLQDLTTLTPDEDLFWASMPGEGELLYVEATDSSVECPIDVVALYETPAAGGTFTKSGPATDAARLQSRVRGEDHDRAMARALEVRDALNGFRGEINGTYYSIRALQRPFDVGAQDGNGRTLLGANYTVAIY